MECATCGCENPESHLLCRGCGAELPLICTVCGSTRLPEDIFCGRCGVRLRDASSADGVTPSLEGERKQVTVLFSDLSDYTGLAARLDPEDLREIMSGLFRQAARIVTDYDGHVEKLIGDAVMAVFGVPTTHEDDVVRAIRAATDIHDLAHDMSYPQAQAATASLQMHSGIATGVVVTGASMTDKGSERMLGSTINLAHRLTGLARPGEILVSHQTYEQADRHFTFEPLSRVQIKGMRDPVRPHKVLSVRERPITVHRLSGLQADLIGREAELAQLREAIRRLQEGTPTVVSIRGDAGTGKSRLVEELKAGLDLDGIQWREAHCYAYTQNTPYFALIDLLSRAWQIEEGDPPENVREKVRAHLESLLGKQHEIAPYMESLYGLSEPELEGVDPEFLKSRIYEGVASILDVLATTGPTIIFVEDVHWADPSSVDLLRFMLLEMRHPALFLLTYRPPFHMFTPEQLETVAGSHRVITLQDLSASEAQDMMNSLLRTEDVPGELRRLVQQKGEGNPFYIEEAMNSLVDSGKLIRQNGRWALSGPVADSDIPLTISRIISARLDLLEPNTKRLLLEASVIGRVFLYEILRRISQSADGLDRCLEGLEELDLIRTRAVRPDLEYVFKHALTQEVAYASLLTRERREIHERIGQVVEQLFEDRLPDFYEMLAFHYERGKSLRKAVHYLMMSAEKSLKKYSVEESHQYYAQAFEILESGSDASAEDEALLVDLLIKWALVFHYRGDFRGLVDLFEKRVDLAESLADKEQIGMFNLWLGSAMWSREMFEESHKYLLEGLRLGEEAENARVVTYACAFLAWTCADLGLVDEGVAFGRRAREMLAHSKRDAFVRFLALGGLGYACWVKGDKESATEAGAALLEWGHRHSNTRSLVVGNWLLGAALLIDGDAAGAMEVARKGAQISADPLYSQFPKIFLGLGCLACDRFDDAEEPLREVLEFSEEFGADVTGTPARGLMGAVLMGKGEMARGYAMLRDARRSWISKRAQWRYALAEYVLGSVYLQMTRRASAGGLRVIVKNLWFLAGQLPFASRKAEMHFRRAAETARSIGAMGVLGQSYLGLALLHQTKGRRRKARESLAEAIQCFEQCAAQTYLEEAKRTLASLE